MSALSIMVKPVSGACNMHCRYCFYSDVMAHRETAVYPRMSIEALETLVRRAFRYADDSLCFSFQGGEPTLAGEEFFEALVRFERMYNTRGIPVQNAVQTNGYALSDEMIDLFAREHFFLGVSLDGDAVAHDGMRPDRAGAPTFERIRSNIARLEAAGVEFNILCVVNEPVARRPVEVFEALAPYRHLQFIACLDGLDGAKRAYSLTPESYLGFLKKTFDLYERAFFGKHPVSVRSFDNYIGILLGVPPENCAMGGVCGRYFLIEADGGVYPCDFYVLDQWRMGNILETPFNRLAASDTARSFREESLAVPEKCRSCRWYRLCRNGCKRERDPLTGLNRWCESFRGFFEYAGPRLLRLAEAVRARDSRMI